MTNAMLEALKSRSWRINPMLINPTLINPSRINP